MYFSRSELNLGLNVLVVVTAFWELSTASTACRSSLLFAPSFYFTGICHSRLVTETTYTTHSFRELSLFSPPFGAHTPQACKHARAVANQPEKKTRRVSHSCCSVYSLLVPWGRGRTATLLCFSKR